MTKKCMLPKAIKNEIYSCSVCRCCNRTDDMIYNVVPISNQSEFHLWILRIIGMKIKYFWSLLWCGQVRNTVFPWILFFFLSHFHFLQLNMIIYKFKLPFWQVYDLQKLNKYKIRTTHWVKSWEDEKISDNQRDSLNRQEYVKIRSFFAQTQIQRYILSFDLILISKNTSWKIKRRRRYSAKTYVLRQRF